MSVARDFESRPRAATGASKPESLSPVPAERTSYTLDRSGSTISRASTNDGGMRFRRPSRSNTVTTYHEPERHDPTWIPGAEPGIDTSAEDDRVPPQVKSLKDLCEINIIDFSESDVRHKQADNDSLAKALEDPRPDDMPCRWISVNGISWDVIKCLGRKFHLHRLAIEDIIPTHTHTRTKVDWYADHACIILTLQKLVRLHNHKGYNGTCACNERDDVDQNEKPEQRPNRKWWQRKPPNKGRQSALPYYLDKDDDGNIDPFVNAHSSTSEQAPIKPIRTLHRYESAQIPEHTAFMEKHSTLSAESHAVSVEQVAIFLLADNTVISFFEQSAEDVEAPILSRLQSPETMLRRSNDASLLCQAIIDAIVDLAAPVRDAYNKARKELQVDAMVNPNIATSRSLHVFGEEIDMLQNLIKPIVHLVNALRDHNSEPVQTQSPPTVMVAHTDDHPSPLAGQKTKRDRERAPMMNRKISEFRRTGPLRLSDNATSVSITPLAHTYFGDVLDHCITMSQTLEQMDASASNTSTLIFNTVGAKTNNFMMILAVVTVFFSPLTFISGYFGMNFSNGSGLDHPFAFFWIVAIPSMVVFMLIVFMTMLWDNIMDFFHKRGIRAHRHRRNRTRRMRNF